MKTYNSNVTWYSPKDILPTTDCECVIVHNGTVLVAWYFSPDRMFSFGDYTVNWDDIDYWAFLPQAPEVKQ